jgi:tetratricopeptide (TPR) repeat protein
MLKNLLILGVLFLIAPSLTHAQSTIGFFERIVTNVIIEQANTYQEVFEYGKARRIVDNALTLFPNSATLWTERGRASLLLYEWDVALDDFNTAISNDSAYALAYFYRADLYYTRLERELAIADFEQYLILAPDGDFANRAQQSIESIRIELQALGN